MERGLTEHETSRKLTNDWVSIRAKVQLGPGVSIILSVCDALSLYAFHFRRIASGADGAGEDGGVEYAGMAIPAVLDHRPVEYASYVIQLGWHL